MRNAIVASDLLAITTQYALPWHRLKGQKVLITGASGFLAAYMVETLLFLNETQGLEIQIFALVRSRQRFERRFAHAMGRADLICIEQDVSEPLAFDVRPDYIVHAASQASPKYYSTDPIGTLSANTLGTAALLKRAAESGSKGFLFFSSGEVYGQTDSVPTSERDFGFVDPTSVRACYAESKRMGENMCISWQHQAGVPATIVRPFHTYGPHMLLNDGRVYADFVANILNNQPITMKGDGTARRAFCYAADAVAGFWTVLFNGAHGEAYNVGNPEGEISIRELAEMLAGLYPEKKLSVLFAARENDSTYLVSPIVRNCPDIAKVKKLGWLPRTSVREGFKKTIESYT
ncbi:NAD-dependent epimerase/dehydratase family protein [Pseudomonas sp. TE24901]